MHVDRSDRVERLVVAVRDPAAGRSFLARFLRSYPTSTSSPCARRASSNSAASETSVSSDFAEPTR